MNAKISTLEPCLEDRFPCLKMYKIGGNCDTWIPLLIELK